MTSIAGTSMVGYDLMEAPVICSNVVEARGIAILKRFDKLIISRTEGQQQQGSETRRDFSELD